MNTAANICDASFCDALGDLMARCKAESRPAFWGAVFAMTVCAFARVASEFMPISLLTPMAADLYVSKGLAGQGITISGALAALASVSISAPSRS